MHQELDERTEFDLISKIDGKSTVISSRTGPFKEQKRIIKVYPESNEHQDVHIVPRKGQRVYTDLVRVNINLEESSTSDRLVKIDEIIFKQSLLNGCTIHGIYIQYMSSSSYKKRVNYSSYVKFDENTCKARAGNLKVMCGLDSNCSNI